MPVLTAAPTHSSTVSSSRILIGKISALRTKVLMVAVLTGTAMAVAVGVEMLALAMFMDWWLDLPRWIRALMLFAQLAILGFILWRMVIVPIIRQPSDDELALMVEKARPEFKSRLIASVQLTRPGALGPNDSASMVEAMVEQTEAVAAPQDFTTIVSTERLQRIGILAASMLVLGLAGFFYGQAVTFGLLKRVFLSNTPVPRKTRVFVIDADKVVGRGDNVRLEAFVKGIVPATGKLVVRHRSRREQQYALEQDRAIKEKFGRTLENVQDTFTYQIRLNDGVSPWHQVQTVPRPTVATIVCDQEFPAYTELKPVRRSLGDLSLLAGSTLKVQAAATKELQSAAIRLSGIEGELPMALSASNINGQFTVPAKGLNGFSIYMVDTGGMESRDSAVYRVEIIPDKVPLVRLTYPERKEELVTRQALMIIGMDVSDDFKISKLRLRYKADTLDNGADKTLDLDLAGQQPQKLRRRFEWNLRDFKPLLAEGTRIEYWIEAEDNNNATGPGTGFSERQYLKVVSVEEKRADLLNRAGDYLGSISDVAADQEKLNRTLGQIIREKTGITR
ncbi:MAG TPA: hypothetical protein VFC26_12270 [Verrucomicrobiae bacterium]|nr:hypothetical protein [Verrucomicrobiae bacterium]